MAVLVDEGFEGAGYDNGGEGEIVDGANTLDPDAAHPATPPPGLGSQCLQAICVDAANDDAMAYWNPAGNQTIFYLRCYVYVDSEGLSNGELFSPLGVTDPTAAFSVSSVEIGQNAGQLQARYQYYSSGSNQTTSWVNINLDQWYLFETQYDASANDWEWKINGISQASGSLAAATSSGGLYLVGNINHTGSAATTVFCDGFVVDDANWIGAAGAPIPIIMHHLTKNIGQ